MSKLKIAFFDLDWTLYDHHNKGFNKSGIEAIKKAKRNGVKVFLCSARPFYSLKGIGAFDLGVRWDGYIASCGAIAKVGRKYVRKLIIPPSDVRRFIRSAKKRGLTMEVVSCYRSALILPETEYCLRYHEKLPDTPVPIHPYKGGEVTAMLLFSTEKFDEGMAKENPNLNLIRFCEYGVDVMKHEHEKGEAISDVLTYYGYDKTDAISFGDDIQDISMKTFCREFVCMGNGKDEVKEEATYVTDRIENGGLMKAMKHFGLID